MVLEDFVNTLWRVITALDFYKFKLELVYLIAAEPKAPLCKGSCQPNRLTEGLLPQYDFAETLQ